METRSLITCHCLRRRVLYLGLLVALAVSAYKYNVRPAVFPLQVAEQQVPKDAADVDELNGDTSADRSTWYWQHGRLVQGAVGADTNKPCVVASSNPTNNFGKSQSAGEWQSPSNTSFLLVGDSVTRHVCFALVETLCKTLKPHRSSHHGGHLSCEGLPAGKTRGVRCADHQFFDHEEHFQMRYINQHYGLDPLKIVQANFTNTSKTDVVYWQSGLWILSENKDPEKATQVMREEYSRVLRSAMELCRQGKVTRFYIAETMTTLGGTRGDMWVDELNAILHEQYDSLVIKDKNNKDEYDDAVCVRLFLTTWPTKDVNDTQHIDQRDKVHPSLEATDSMAPLVWSTMLGNENPSNSCLPPAQNLSRESPIVKDGWCENNPTYVVHDAVH